MKAFATACPGLPALGVSPRRFCFMGLVESGNNGLAYGSDS